MREKNEMIVSGFYNPQMVTEKRIGRKIMPLYPDARYTEQENCIEVERRMMIDKQPIVVRSFFIREALQTPTQQMLRMIDRDLEKCEKAV